MSGENIAALIILFFFLGAFYICGMLIYTEGSDNPNRSLARGILTFPVWPLIVSIFGLYWAGKGLFWVFKNAELLPNRKPDYKKIHELELERELEDTKREIELLKTELDTKQFITKSQMKKEFQRRGEY